MASRRLLFALACVSFFLWGAATGQKTESRFAEYYKTQPLDKMEWRLLQANLNIIRQRIGFDKDGVGVPDVTFDSAHHTFSAWAWVDADALEGLPTDKLKTRLTSAALATLSETNSLFKAGRANEGLVTMDNFEMQFRGIAFGRMLENTERNIQLDKEAYEFYAEYKNGELTLRSKTPGLK